MAQSEQQKAILVLGKLLVKELGIETSVDTLSRWMAHYLAEKITVAEGLPDGAKKNAAEKECYSLILELWKTRWSFKPDKQPLKHFQHLFTVLEKLDPDSEQPYYYRFNNREEKEIADDSFNPAELNNLTPLALQIDKVARIWIDFVLRDAAAKTKNERIEKIVEQAVKLPESMDAHIIQIVIAEEVDELDNDLTIDHEKKDRKSRLRTLNKRIAELEKFKKVNEFILSQFKKERDEIKVN